MQARAATPPGGQPRGVALDRITIFAKGNLDVHDTLHSLRVGGVVVWNGINEILRERHPGVIARIRHETWTRSDALLAAGGRVPRALAGRDLALGPYPVASQFSRAVFETDADAYVLTIQPDVATYLFRHRQDGFPLMAYDNETWPERDRQWLRDEFEPVGLLDVDASMRNLAAIAGRLAARSGAPVLVYNVSSIVPGDTVHCYAGLDETLATRIRRFNVALSDLSQRTGISIVDVDAVIARAGADRLKLDAFHLNDEGCRLVAAEAVRVLDDLGALARSVTTR